MFKTLILAGIAAVGIAISAHADDKGQVVYDQGNVAQFYSGNTFYDMCSKFPNDRACWGYVAGIADVMSSNKRSSNSINGRMACVPDEAPVMQLRDVVVHFLQEHPKDRHAPASELVAGALAQAFPCPTASQACR
jgi:hypothetical protein